MSAFTVRSWAIAIVLACSAGVAAGQTASPFNDNAFVGRDSADNVTALFAELTAGAEAPAQIDVILFYDAAGSVVAALENVPVKRLPPSRWVFATRPALLSPAMQSSILGATTVSFVVNNALANASFATLLDWRQYLPYADGSTGSCPNCARLYLCCISEIYDLNIREFLPYCNSVTKWMCRGILPLGPKLGNAQSR